MSGTRKAKKDAPPRLYLQLPDFFLQTCQKAGGMHTVHLRMVELERNGQPLFPKTPPVFAPYSTAQ